MEIKREIYVVVFVFRCMCFVLIMSSWIVGSIYSGKNQTLIMGLGGNLEIY